MSLFATSLDFLAVLGGDSIGLVLIAKWTVVLALAWLAHGLLAGRNPRWRVALWRLAVVGKRPVAILSSVPPIVTYRSASRDRPSDGVVRSAPTTIALEGQRASAIASS